MNFCKILARKIFSETALNTLLNFEYSAFFGVSERYGTVVEIYVKVAYDLFFLNDYGRNIGGSRQYVDIVNL